MIRRPERKLLLPNGNRLSSKEWCQVDRSTPDSWYPPALDPEHPPIFEWVKHFGEWRCFWYDAHEAERWITWYRDNIVFIEGEAEVIGQPMPMLDWQLGPTRELFGWKCVNEHTNELTDARRYQTGFVLVPKKNSKTTWGAGLTLAAMELDEMVQGQFYCAAATKEQAGDTAFRIAYQMCEKAPHLAKNFAPFETIIDHIPSSSFLRLISSAPTGKSGKNVHWVLLDEYWELTQKGMVRQLRTGMQNQKSPMLLIITTSGDDINRPAYQDYQEAKKILTGETENARYLPVIYEPDDGDDWRDKEVWRKVNPAWGITVNPDVMEQTFSEALGKPDAEADFQQFLLNKWVTGGGAFLQEHKWQACAEDFDAESLRGQVCYGGIDFAQNHDFNAFSLCFPAYDEDDPRREKPVIYKLLTWYWIPELTAQTRQALGVKVNEWIRSGLITSTPGDTTDFRIIRADILRILAKYDFKMLRCFYDRRFALSTVLDMQDIDGLQMVECDQGWKSLGVAIHNFENLIGHREIRHNSNEVLNWNVANAFAVSAPDGSEAKLLNKKKSKDKIDGLHSGTMAFYAAQLAGPPVLGDPYAERGLFVW